MSNWLIKDENVFPEKVYFCPCLENAVNKIFNKQIRFYTEMTLAILEFVLAIREFFVPE